MLWKYQIKKLKTEKNNLAKVNNEQKKEKQQR